MRVCHHKYTWDYQTCLLDPCSLIYGDVCTFKAHLSTRNVNHFNFQEYIQRSLDDDFKVVVGIRYSHKLTTILMVNYFSFSFSFHIYRSSSLNIYRSMYLYMPLFGSPLMWFLVAIFLLLDVRGKYGLPFIFCIHLIYASFSLQLYISSHAIFFTGMFRLECIPLDFLCSTRGN